MNASLRTEIEAAAGRVEVRPGDLDGVVRRGRHRRRRARQVAGSLTAVAVLAVVLVAVRMGGDDSSSTVFAGGVGSAVLGDSGIEWTRTDLDPAAALGASGFPRNEMVEAGTDLYALSTAPGTGRDAPMPSRVLWRSGDGLRWSQVTGPDFALDELTADRAGRLYAVGTGPAVTGSAADTVHFGWSDGNGWNDTQLPLDTTALTAGTRRVHVGTEDVAVGPAGIVVVARVGVELDVAALVPDGVSTEHGWALIDGGVGILGPGEPCPENLDEVSVASTKAPVAGSGDGPGEVTCMGADGYPVEPATIVARLDWDVLGVGGDLRSAVQGQPFVFHAPSTDVPFTRVDANLGGVLAADSTFVEAGDDGFDLVAAAGALPPGRSRLVALHSPDGRTWTASAALENLGAVMALGRVDGKLAVVGFGTDGPPKLEYAELDGGAWRTTDLGAFIGEDLGASAAAIGPLGVLVTGVRNVDGDTRLTLFSSRDGHTWSADDVEALTGETRIAMDSRITVRADRAVVSLGIAQPDGSPSRPIALVGTPR